MIGKADALQLVFCRLSAKWIDQQGSQRHTSHQQIGGNGVGHGGQHDGRNHLHALCKSADGLLLAPCPYRPGKVQGREQQLDGQTGDTAQPLPEVAPDHPALDLILFILGHRESPLSSAGRWSRPANTQSHYGYGGGTPARSPACPTVPPGTAFPAANWK